MEFNIFSQNYNSEFPNNSEFDNTFTHSQELYPSNNLNLENNPINSSTVGFYYENYFVLIFLFLS